MSNREGQKNSRSQAPTLEKTPELNVEAPSPVSEGSETAWDLFADRGAIERRMTNEIRDQILEEHGVALREEEAFAA